LGWVNYDEENFHDAEQFFKEVMTSHDTQENYNEIILFYLKTKRFRDAADFSFEIRDKI